MCGLQIESSEETDQGKYECVASNSAGVRYSPPANLYVRGAEGLSGTQHPPDPPGPAPVLPRPIPPLQECTPNPFWGPRARLPHPRPKRTGERIPWVRSIPLLPEHPLGLGLGLVLVLVLMWSRALCPWVPQTAAGCAVTATLSPAVICPWFFGDSAGATSSHPCPRDSPWARTGEHMTGTGFCSMPPRCSPTPWANSLSTSPYFDLSDLFGLTSFHSKNPFGNKRAGLVLLNLKKKKKTIKKIPLGGKKQSYIPAMFPFPSHRQRRRLPPTLPFLSFSGHSETAQETKVVTRCCLHTWMRGLQVLALALPPLARVYLGLPRECRKRRVPARPVLWVLFMLFNSLFLSLEHSFPWWSQSEQGWAWGWGQRGVPAGAALPGRAPLPSARSSTAGRDNPAGSASLEGLILSQDCSQPGLVGLKGMGGGTIGRQERGSEKKKINQFAADSLEKAFFYSLCVSPIFLFSSCHCVPHQTPLTSLRATRRLRKKKKMKKKKNLKMKREKARNL
ncbi:hypothetical protein IHE44_0010062 [Lamprotornis superbus]|uniref:Uncharacterized protein n=1 Tax=Lamprotornis superbus TaxID=245042 RepID=A0A835TRZ6_9PASS|nr:hypothetical protein IHE44_0010062 [Lamprotornis superbus]